jgi:hypothetical protein
LGRSSARGRRPAAARAAARVHAPSSADAGALDASLASATLPRSGQGLVYRPLDDAARVRSLFDYAALSWPRQARTLLAWGAFQPASDGEELVGGVVAEQAGRSALLHGPVVVSNHEPLQIAAVLVSAILDHAVAAGVSTLFAQPQGLDRIWVRYGFIPLPEGTLPEGLSGRAGEGLYAWRGGSAVWSLRSIDSG